MVKCVDWHFRTAWGLGLRGLGALGLEALGFTEIGLVFQVQGLSDSMSSLSPKDPP